MLMHRAPPSQIIHTDNGKEFINMCYDRKYKGARFDHLTDEEFRKTKTIVSHWNACSCIKNI